MSVLHDQNTRTLSRWRPVFFALLFGSGICYAMLAAHCWVSSSKRLTGLGGNLVLAWIPLGLAAYVRGSAQPAATAESGPADAPVGGGAPLPPAGLAPGPQTGVRTRCCRVLAALLWVLFFPNCFYIVTDLIHLRKFGGHGVPGWYDMLMTASFAFVGVFLGTLSLYLLHLSVRERFGWRAGWAFAGMMLLLGALGIYVGRFLRWNSWDVFTRPEKLWRQFLDVRYEVPRLAVFTVTFLGFSLMVYVFLLALARVHERDR